MLQHAAVGSVTPIPLILGANIALQVQLLILLAQATLKPTRRLLIAPLEHLAHLLLRLVAAVTTWLVVVAIIADDAAVDIEFVVRFG